MKISSIVSLPQMNVARAVIDGDSYKKGTSEELASAILQHGWDETSAIGVRVPTEEELVVINDYLILESDRLQALPSDEQAYKLVMGHDLENKAIYCTLSNAEVSAEFQHTYFAKGKLKPLTKVRLTVFGHHRTHMVLIANAARARNSITRVEPKALEHTYDTAQAWKDACIAENANRDRAITKTDALDVLRQARSLRDGGNLESHHRKTLGNKQVGAIQRAWRFLKLDLHHPDLNLYLKAMLPERNADKTINTHRILFKSLTKERLQKLLNTNDAGQAATSEEVWAYISEPLAKTNKPLTSADLKTITEIAPCATLKSLLSDIAVGKRDTLTMLNGNSLLFNAVGLPTDILSIDESIEQLEKAIEELKKKKLDLE